MLKNPMGNFEIPTEMRNVAEQSVVQARQAFDGFMSAAQKAIERVEEQTVAAQAGAKGAGEKAMSFAEKNISSSFDFAQRLVRAKDMEEMMRIQSEFMRSQMETLSNQAKELGQAATRGGQEQAGGKGS
jgi:phasin